jgi:hypothetical protein
MTSPIAIPYRLFTIDLDLQSDKPVSRFLAATLRGGFGYTLKRLVCSFRSSECTRCLLKSKCIYSFLFETAPSPDAPRLRKYRTVPRPFAFRPRQTGDRVTIELLLIGDAVGMLPFFIHALNELGRTGLGRWSMPFTVKQVSTETGTCIYRMENPGNCLPAEPLILEIGPGQPGKGTLTFRFTTPLTLRKDGITLRAFEPRTFVTTLLRRVTNLNAFYGSNREIETDPAPWINAMDALTLVDMELFPHNRNRFSTRQKKNIDYPGFTGDVRIDGEVGTLMPLFKAGEILGVGKNTVFGYGVYRCNVVAATSPSGLQPE